MGPRAGASSAAGAALSGKGSDNPREMCPAWQSSGLDRILAKWQETPPSFSTTVGSLLTMGRWRI